MAQFILERRDFDQLFSSLANRGYKIVGPTLRDGAIIYDELRSSSDLPESWTDEQNGGFYRIKRRSDRALFGYAVGPHSWKKYLHPPAVQLWQAEREGGGFRIIQEKAESLKYAFLGVRSCELHAIAVQDNVFIKGKTVDPCYASRRENAFIIAVNCGQAGGACFCVSMNTGPKATTGYDLALTEILENDRHYFVLDAGTALGEEVLKEISHREADSREQTLAEDAVAETAKHMGRALDTSGIKELLYKNYEHPRWDETAQRCLTCANCTMVCPTCFCTTVEDVSDLTGDHVERWRKWDSCFNMDFSYIHGGSVRSSVKSRYRQWMTHKLATWIDQFGTSGCVGCGRCIVWCPVAIDITEEARAIRESEGGKGGGNGDGNS